MILMPQIFDVIDNENARYKRNELEFNIPDFEGGGNCFAHVAWYVFHNLCNL